MQIAQRVKKVAPSLTLTITARAKELKKSGLDVVGFGAGEPDFDTPDYIKQAAKESLDKGQTKYTPVTGLQELKEIICKKFKDENGLEYIPDQIAVSCGAKHSLYNYFQAVINPGDEVLVPVPYWVSYPPQILMADGIPVYIPTDSETDYKITPELLDKYVTLKTKGCILNSPSNPSGMMYTEDELRALADYFVAKNIPVISDEIYEHISYDFPHVSIASFNDDIKQLTTVINGVSKSFSMTGWRIGYMASSIDVIKAVNKIQGHSTSNPTTTAQWATIAALNGGLDFVRTMCVEFKKRRDYMVDRLNSIKGMSCIMPQGAFYAYPSIAEIGMDSMKFCQRLLEEYQTAAVPGVAFGNDENIRLSYAVSMDAIKKGLDRIDKFVNNL